MLGRAKQTMVPDSPDRSDGEAAVEEPPALTLEEPPVPGLEETLVPALEEPPVPGLEETFVPALEEPPVPALEETLVPALEEPPVSALGEPPVSALGEPPVPALEEPPISALEEPPAPALEEPPVPGPSRAVTFYNYHPGEPLVFSSVVKFAFDVMDLVSELCNIDFRLPRPSFYPCGTDLMTAEIREVFERHEYFTQDLYLILMMRLLPSVNDRTQLENVLNRVVPIYSVTPFTTELFVQYCFLIVSWTHLIHKNNHWNEAPKVGLEMIIHLTRGVLNRGGFGVCDKWPTEEDVRGSAIG